MDLERPLEEPERRRREDRHGGEPRGGSVRPGPAQRPQERDDDGHDDDLSDLDADVEEEQRGDEAGGREVHVLQDVRKAEAVHEAEQEAHQPSLVEPREEQILEGHVRDAERDACLHQRRGQRHDVERGEGKGHAVGDRERGHDLDDSEQRAPDQEETQQERDVIVAQKDVMNSHAEELEGGGPETLGAALVRDAFVEDERLAVSPMDDRGQRRVVGSELGQGRGAYRDRRQRRRAAKAQRDLEQILAVGPPADRERADVHGQRLAGVRGRDLPPQIVHDHRPLGIELILVHASVEILVQAEHEIELQEVEAQGDGHFTRLNGDLRIPDIERMGVERWRLEEEEEDRGQDRPHDDYCELFIALATISSYQDPASVQVGLSDGSSWKAFTNLHWPSRYPKTHTTGCHPTSSFGFISNFSIPTISALTSGNVSRRRMSKWGFLIPSVARWNSATTCPARLWNEWRMLSWPSANEDEPSERRRASTSMRGRQSRVIVELTLLDRTRVLPDEREVVAE